MQACGLLFISKLEIHQTVLVKRSVRSTKRVIIHRIFRHNLQRNLSAKDGLRGLDIGDSAFSEESILIGGRVRNIKEGGLSFTLSCAPSATSTFYLS